MSQGESKIEFTVVLSSTNRALLKAECDQMVRVVANYVRGVKTEDPERLPMIGVGNFKMEKIKTGNRDLTLRRSPHGNKKHRDSFVPSRWEGVQRMTLTAVPHVHIPFVKMAIQSSTQHTFKLMMLDCNHGVHKQGMR